MDAQSLVADLDADQRRAVTTPARLVAVIAGAGSGKTRVLTRRVAHRIATGDADPQHTLVLTFTREAAGELRRRLPTLGITGRVTSGTLHAIARSILLQRWADLDQRPYEILDDRRRFVAALADRAPADGLLSEVEWAAARGLSGEQYESAVRRGRSAAVAPSLVAAMLERYAAEKRRRRLVDLDDLLTITTTELERDPTFAAGLRWRYRHVLVDEAQDLTPIQHRLVDLLTADTRDLFLVGDPAQAVYGFAGADPQLLVDVADHFPGIEVIRLPVNHRCTPQIVAAGVHVLRTAEQPIEAVSALPDGRSVTIEMAADEAGEAAAIVGRIGRTDPTVIGAGHVAVLARTHAAARAVRDSLAGAGIAVRTDASHGRSPLTQALHDAYRQQQPAGLRRWAQDAVERSRDESGIVVDRALAAVGQAVVDFLREKPVGDGTDLRAWIATVNPFGEITAGVEVQTFHAAKGREWRIVHVLGCETGLMPHRSARTAAAKAEEARLLYVALTRATEQLHVSWAERRGGYRRKLSPLLDGFDGSAPAPVRPPAALVGSRSPRLVTLDLLRKWRDEVAARVGVAAQAVAADQVLSRIADAHPTSAAELDAATGLGPITSSRLWPGIEAALAGDAGHLGTGTK